MGSAGVELSDGMIACFGFSAEDPRLLSRITISTHLTMAL